MDRIWFWVQLDSLSKLRRCCIMEHRLFWSNVFLQWQQLDFQTQSCCLQRHWWLDYRRVLNQCLFALFCHLFRFVSEWRNCYSEPSLDLWMMCFCLRVDAILIQCCCRNCWNIQWNDQHSRWNLIVGILDTNCFDKSRNLHCAIWSEVFEFLWSGRLWDFRWVRRNKSCWWELDVLLFCWGCFVCRIVNRELELTLWVDLTQWIFHRWFVWVCS